MHEVARRTDHRRAGSSLCMQQSPMSLSLYVPQIYWADFGEEQVNTRALELQIYDGPLGLTGPAVVARAKL